MCEKCQNFPHAKISTFTVFEETDDLLNSSMAVLFEFIEECYLELVPNKQQLMSRLVQEVAV